MEVREIAGIAVALIVLAGVSVAVVNGGSSAQILGSGANGFANMIKAATLRG